MCQTERYDFISTVTDVLRTVTGQRLLSKYPRSNNLFTASLKQIVNILNKKKGFFGYPDLRLVNKPRMLTPTTISTLSAVRLTSGTIHSGFRSEFSIKGGLLVLI
jgi:hypothetical protein